MRASGNRKGDRAVRGVAMACILAAVGHAFADENSRGPSGISSTGLGLTGMGVRVGQVELGRPGVPGVDMAANSNGLVTPAAGFLLGFGAVANAGVRDISIDNHAEGVAGTIISTGGLSGGVAQSAQLFASAFTNPLIFIGVDSGRMCTSVQQMIDSGARIINHSYGSGGTLDSRSQRTLMVDWSAAASNVLHTIAGNESGPSFGFNVPTDSFNGMVVASSQVGVDGLYSVIAAHNVTRAHPTPNDPNTGVRRRTIDIMAPGTNLTLADLGTGNTYVASGTSFAAPHVAGAAALLSENATNRGLGANAQRHEVLKASMMNSADKRAGILGMDRTIFRGTVNSTAGNGVPEPHPNLDWIQQRAVEVTAGLNRNQIPLDEQLGTGHLNVSRAVTQMNAGQQGPGPVNVIGWDYNTVTPDQIRRYEINQMIAASEWIAVTLAWDRRVTLTNNAGAANHFDAEYVIDLNNNGVLDGGDLHNDLNADGMYDSGLFDTLAVTGPEFPQGIQGLQDLDIYVVPRGGDRSTWVAQSVSAIYSVEHLFFQFTAGGDYDILVHNFNGPFGDAQAYGLAWWTVVPAPGAAPVLMFTLVILRRRRR